MDLTRGMWDIPLWVWFGLHPTRFEFLRILKPGGWLAILRNVGTNRELGQALAEVLPAGGVLDTSDGMVGRDVPKRLYYGGVDVPRQTFAFTTHQTWDAFLGGLATAADAPDETSPLYAGFERAARRVFDRFAAGDHLGSHAMTELYLGQVTVP